MGNLIELEGKAKGLFSNLSIFQTEECVIYTSFWKLGSLFYDIKNTFWNFLIFTPSYLLFPICNRKNLEKNNIFEGVGKKSWSLPFKQY